MFDSNSLAAANAVGAKNVVFKPIASVLERKIVIIGTYDPAKTAVVDEVAVQIFSPEDAGDQFGFGTMLHRLAVRAFQGSRGIETWVVPQSETGIVAVGDIDFVGSTGVLAGVLSLYIAGILVEVAIEAADTADNIATKVAAAVTAKKELPLSGIATTTVCDFTAKNTGLWGNDISITLNEKAGEVLPTGVTAAVTDMASGTTVPAMVDALAALGSDDNQNEKFFTDFIHGYGNDTTSLDALSTYNGIGNDFVGNYKKVVSRPFRSLNGDVATGSGGLTAVLALGNGRLNDRTSGTISVPGSPNHPSEISALAIGIMARLNNNRAEETAIGQLLPEIIPGALADRWTSAYDSRDLAVKAGISPTLSKNGAVIMQNVVSYYHPDNVPVESNGYRSMRNISITQNLLNSVKDLFALEKWQGISIVSDVTKVTNVNSRAKARDVDAVLDDLVAIAKEFASNAWIFSSAFTIAQLQGGSKVSIRVGGDGFNITLPVVYSGEGGIFNTEIEFDVSLAIVLS